MPAGMRLYGVSPPLLEAFAANVGYFRDGTDLSPQSITMIRYLVSERAGCRFCIDLNEGFLADMGADLEAARAARADPGRASVTEAERPLRALALQAASNRAFNLALKTFNIETQEAFI